MGLISNEVDVSLGARNIKHYEDLGYEMPRRNKNGRVSVQIGATIIVKTEHLPHGSHVFVDCKCDGCDKPLRIMWNDYKERNHDGKIYCRNCILSKTFI